MRQGEGTALPMLASAGSQLTGQRGALNPDRWRALGQARDL